MLSLVSDKLYKDAPYILDLIKQGAFVVTGYEEPNVMCVSYASIGPVFMMPTICVYIRKDRYTSTIIEQNREFNIVLDTEGKHTLLKGICGSKSGHFYNKVEEQSIPLIVATTNDAPIIAWSNYTIECRVIAHADIGFDTLDKGIQQEEYPTDSLFKRGANSSTHTCYWAEVTCIHQREDGVVKVTCDNPNIAVGSIAWKAH